jgi:hypothetical protein
MNAPVDVKDGSRLIRYVPAGAMPGLNLVSIWDALQELLIVNKGLFEQLSPSDQRTVLRTHKPSITMNLTTRTLYK